MAKKLKRHTLASPITPNNLLQVPSLLKTTFPHKYYHYIGPKVIENNETINLRKRFKTRKLSTTVCYRLLHLKNSQYTPLKMETPTNHNHFKSKLSTAVPTEIRLGCSCLTNLFQQFNWVWLLTTDYAFWRLQLYCN